MNHYLGPFEQTIRDPGGPDELIVFGPPGGDPSWTRMEIRRISGTPWGIFSSNLTLASPYELLGTGDAGAVDLRGQARNAWNATFGTSLSAGTTLADAIRDTTDIVPGFDRMVRLNYQGVELAAESVDSLRIDRRSRLVSLVKEMYRSAYEDVAAGRSLADFNRKFLWTLAQKMFGRVIDAEAQTLIPAGLPIVTPLPPSTTYSDAFPYANNASLATASSGAWAEAYGGSIKVASNQAQRGGANDGQGRYESDVSSTDHYAQTLVVNGNAGSGAMARFSSSADTAYAILMASGGAWDKGRYNAGSWTSLATGDIGGPGSGDGVTVKIECNGSLITASYDGNTLDSATDGSPISTGTRGGIHLSTTNSAVDDWTMEDLAAGGGVAWHLSGNRSAATISHPTTWRLNDI